MRYRLLILILVSFFIFFVIVTACERRTQDPNILIDQAVAATLAARPEPTREAAPFSTPYPTPTAFDLRGLFCEYQFCMGHPQDMAFYDVSAQQSSGSPSTYSQGILASYNANLFIQMIWQISPGASDPQFLLDLILDEGIDTKVGNLDVKQIRDMNVVYTPLTTTATPILPFGGAAAWTCGERVFAWKVYTPDEASPLGLFETSLARFTCNR